MRIMRITRVLRLLRLLRVFKELWLMVQGIMHSVPPEPGGDGGSRDVHLNTS